ncbi:MAG: T9SS type A sorting domain-containing protein [Paludibacteraceae bacterium]|nr:T9SS type A sorting domain-containing protein [Paludibacteraceae bacterium]
MKKVLLLTLSALLTFNMFAAGNGDGSSKENAIEFDWEKGNVQEGGLSLWYSVGLAPLYEEENPALALYLTNLTKATAKVEVEAVVAGNNEQRNYTLDGHQNKVWSQSAGLLVRMKYKEILVKLTSDQQVMLSAKVYEFQDADDACVNAKDFTIGATVKATSAWFKVGIEEAKQNGKDIQVTITNNGPAAATIHAGISADCPSTGLTEKTFNLGAGASIQKQLSNSMVNTLKDDFVYALIEANQEVSVKAEYVTPKGVEYDVPACESAELAELDKVYNVAAGGDAWYQIPVKDLMGKRMQPQVIIQNEGGSKATIKGEVIFACGKPAAMTKTITIAANGVLVKDIAKNMVDGIDTTSYAYVYVHISTDQPLSYYARLKNVHEGDACKTSQEFVFNEKNYQDANTKVWYAISIAEAKAGKKDIAITVNNRANKVAAIVGSVAFECPYTDLQTFSKKLGAADETSKTIKYSTFSMFGDTIYVLVETDQPITISAKLVDAVPVDDHSCEGAIDFDWKNGHVQKADTTVWYKVNMADVRNNKDIPELTIINRNQNASVTIRGELSTECPVTVEMQKRNLTIAKGGTYTKLIARDLFKNIKAEYVYIKITANQEFSFQVRMLKEDEGKSCTNAVEFNWVTGNDQEANTSVWYYADMKNVKASEKDVMAKLINRTKQVANLSAEFSNTCPCETPQAQSMKLGANAEKSKLLVNSTFDSYNDTVYFRIITDAAIHFEAKLQEPKPFTPFSVCGTEKAVKPNVQYEQTEDSVWYKAVVSDFSDEKFPGLVPMIVFTNEATAQTIRAYLSYDCNITKAPQMESRKLSANSVASKVIERSMIPNKEYADICLVGKNFSFRIDMVDPNDGHDCRHALDFNVNTDYVQVPGTMWYRFDASAPDIDLYKFIVSANKVSNDAKVTISVYDDCEGELIEEGSATLRSSRQKEIMGDVLKGFSKTGHILVKVVCSEDITFRMDKVERPKLPEAIIACENAKPLLINTDYKQGQNDTVWYVVDAKDLRENTVGDGVLSIHNIGATNVKIKAEVAYICPVEYEMTSKQISVKAGEDYSKLLERAKFNSVTAPLVYVRLISTDSIAFRIDLKLAKGDDCLNPIDFDWAHGNVNPKDSCLWYNVPFYDTKKDTILIWEGYDVRLHIDNLSDSTVSMEAAMRFECDSMEMYHENYSLVAGASKTKDIDRDLIVKTAAPHMLINVCSNQNIHIWAEFIPEKADSVIVNRHYAFVCPGEEYTDPITKQTINVVSDTILSQVTQFQVGTYLVDSIDSVFLTQYRAVEAIEIVADDILPEQLANVAVVGQKLNTAVLFAYIKDTLNALAMASDTIAPIDTIKWEAIDPADGLYHNIIEVEYLQSELTGDPAKVTLKYMASTECANVVTTGGVVLVVKEKPCETTTYIDEQHVCQGITSIDWRGFVNAVDGTKDTIVNVAGCDSIITLKLIDDIKPIAVTDVKYVCDVNQTIWWHGMSAGNGAKDILTSVITGCDSVVTLQLVKKEPQDPIVLNPANFPTVCGEDMGAAISAQNAAIMASFKTEDQYDEVTKLVWYKNVGGIESQIRLGVSWILNAKDADEEFSIYCIAEMKCGEDLQSNVINIKVQSASVGKMKIVSKFGNRILVLNLNDFKTTNGFTPSEADVEWYKKNTVNPRNPDTHLGNGFYYNNADGSVLESGIYYAVLSKPNPNDCGAIYVSNEIEVASNDLNLVPNVVNRGGLMTIHNVDPTQETSVCIIDATGRVVEDNKFINMENVNVEAAWPVGAYLMRVENATQSDTFRFLIVR